MSMDTPVRIALANVPFPATPDQAIAIAKDAVARAGAAGAAIVCFPECLVPGYRAPHAQVPPPDPAFLERAWTEIAGAARRANIAVILGTERVMSDGVRIAALVINSDGTRAGFQDKVQLDPSEDTLYVRAPAPERHVFQCGPLRFGIAICHEGWRYPETVRAAENTCYFATVNYAGDGSPTTSAVVNPDGTLLAWQPYGQEGVLVADLDLAAATGLLALRYREHDHGGR